MDYRNLWRILGAFLVVFGAILSVPAICAWFFADGMLSVFMTTSVLSVLLGALFFLPNARYRSDLNLRTSFAVVTLFWFVACIVGSLPYIFSGALNSVTDGFFETASGFTGTGASVFADVESLPSSILLWRSTTQWLGGLGIIVFFVALLPLLGIGSMQLFKAETSGPNKDKFTPRIQDTAKALWIIYISITILSITGLCLSGMTLFDAITHGFAAVATGGFSTKNSGIAFYNSPTIDIVLTVTMASCATNFTIYYRLIAQRDWSAIFHTELKWFCSILVTISFLVTIFNLSYYNDLLLSLRHSVFTVINICSTTGFTNANYVEWPTITNYLLILVMVMGGMSGSTAGGIKCIRLLSAFKQLSKELVQVIHPRAVISIKADHHSVPTNLVSAMWGMIFLYFFTFSIAAGILIEEGLDMISSCSAVFSALSGVGPALGKLGPMDNYSLLTDLQKWTLSFCMILGRLEFYTVLVLFTRAYWKK